jgi:hypothetical protein
MGLTEVEYVGHLIDKHGISFTKEKKDKVVEFRLPEKHHKMKSFLELCSQYRDHIPNLRPNVNPTPRDDQGVNEK